MLLRPRFQPSIVVALVALAFAVTSCAQERPAAAPPAPPVAANNDHRATLNWAPSPDAKKNGKLKYFVYRSDGIRKTDGTTQCAVTFKKISEVDGATTTYVDRNVQGAHVYCYKISSVAEKTEGRPSEIVIASIPPDKPE